MFKLLSLFLILLFHSVASSQSRDKIQASSLKILQTNGEKVVVKDEGHLSRNQNILVVRLIPDDDDFEIIARGMVKSIQQGRVMISTELNDLKKLPEKSDYVVSLGAPKKFNAPKNSPPAKQSSLEKFDAQKLEPGYISLHYLKIDANLQSQSPNAANSFKKLGKFPRDGFELEWYLDFLSSYGISFGQFAGTVPIESYYRQKVDAHYSEQFFKLHYRTKRYWDTRLIFSFQSLKDDFSTSNPDEYILSTATSSSNLGLTLQYEPGDLLLSGRSSRFQFTYLRLQYFTSFSLKAQDGQVSRGDSGGSQFNEIRLGVNFTTYLAFMPWVKRYFIQVESFSRKKQLNFSGVTRAEARPGAYQIPSDQQYQENESGIAIGIGVRFEDVIGRIFKPRD